MESSDQLEQAPEPAEAPVSGEAEARERVQGRVAGVIKGGFEVEVGDQNAFCSNTQMDLRRIENPAAYLGQVLEFVVLPPRADEPEPARLRLSRRRILLEEERRRQEELKGRIAPGRDLVGRVSRLASFGAFVDLGGVEGLVHLSQLSHEKVESAAERLAVGDEVRVRVLRIEGGGKRISLSVKALERSPWDDAAASLRPWTVIDGRLKRVSEIGAFLELGPGLEGLLHVDELPPGALPHLEEAARAHRRMAVVVLEVDRKRRRIALAPAPGDRQPGDVLQPLPLRRREVVEGRVEEPRKDGVLVRLGPGQLGWIDLFELGTPRGSDHLADFPRGTSIAGEVLSVEAGGRRAILSRKRALRREERAEVQRHIQSQEEMRFPTIGDLLRQAQSKRRPGDG